MESFDCLAWMCQRAIFCTCTLYRVWESERVLMCISIEMNWLSPMIYSVYTFIISYNSNSNNFCYHWFHLYLLSMPRLFSRSKYALSVCNTWQVDCKFHLSFHTKRRYCWFYAPIPIIISNICYIWLVSVKLAFTVFFSCRSQSFIDL